MQPRPTHRRRAAPRGRVALAATALVAGVPILAACSGSSDPAAAAIDRYSGSDAHTVGDVSGATLQGGQLSLASLRGHVVVVDFWSSNCGPCRAEQKSLDEVAHATRRQGVRFVGIDERDDDSLARQFLSDDHASYPSLTDPDGSMTLQFPGAEPQTTPTTIVLDPQGRIVARVNGSIYFTQLRDLVDSVAAASRTGSSA